MFSSRSSFAAAGFEVVRQPASHNIMVGRHPSVEGYLFKKYNNDIPLDEQEENYETRLRGAEKIRAVVDRYRLQHIVVPHKWLYEHTRRVQRDRD